MQHSKHKDELSKGVKALLKNKKFSILDLAYTYNKKKKYKTQNGLRDIIIQDGGINIPMKHYDTYSEIQDELYKLEFDEIITYIEMVYRRAKRICGDYIGTQDKYKQLAAIKYRFEEYENELATHGIIDGIKTVDEDIFKDIIKDEMGVINLNIHISKIHTALHSYLKACAIKSGIDIDKKGIPFLYKQIMKVTKADEIVHNDGQLLSKFDEIRNNNSKAHPSEKELSLRKDVGIIFLDQIRLVYEKVKMQCK